MSQLDPLALDHIMPNVKDKTVAEAKLLIHEHADVPVSADGPDSAKVKSSTPDAGHTITNQVTLVVYNTRR